MRLRTFGRWLPTRKASSAPRDAPQTLASAGSISGQLRNVSIALSAYSSGMRRWLARATEVAQCQLDKALRSKMLSQLAHRSRIALGPVQHDYAGQPPAVAGAHQFTGYR